MKHICPDCGFESESPGNCPSCETPLLRREDEAELEGGVEGNPDEELTDEFGEEPEEEW